MKISTVHVKISSFREKENFSRKCELWGSLVLFRFEQRCMHIDTYVGATTHEEPIALQCMYCCGNTFLVNMTKCALLGDI